MRGLSGDFETMPLKDLVVYLGNRQASGRLALERGDIRKELVLVQGMVVNASSNLPREYLGQFLINLGHITEEQFERAYATQRETRVFLGRILVMIGLVTEETVEAALALKFRETALEAFPWLEGQFHFEPGHAEPPEGIDVRVGLIDIHKESDFRVEAWQQIRAAFPTGGVTLELDRAMLAEEPRPGSIDEKLFQFIEAGQTLDEMALRLHATDFFLYNRLYAYHRLGAVRVKAAEGPGFDIDIEEEVGGPPPADSVRDQARAHLAAGAFREAFAAARRAAQLADSPETVPLLKQIEAEWLPGLRHGLLARPRVPSLTLGPDALARIPLTAPERYLLSRIDGKRDVGTIIRVAPLREFDALAFFDRFESQGWLTWRDRG